MRIPPGSTTLIRHPRILDAVEDLIGPDILVWTSTFFIKEPHSPTFAAWHQDGTYFGLEPHEQVCAWVALTDASAEAGCMEQLSSRGRASPTAPRAAGPGEQHQPRRADHHGAVRRGEPGGDGAARRGQFSLHHELAVHRSAPNNASHRRVGIGLNYIPPHVRVNGPVRLKAMLVRGEDRYGHFDLIDPPAAERDAAALAVHQEVSDRYRENYRVQVQRHEALYAAPGGLGA